MPSTDLNPDWSVEWATPKPSGNGYFDNIVLNREQAVEYGDELVMSLRVDGPMLRERGLDPEEPFAWKIEDGELLTKQIPRQTFEEVAEGDRDDSSYAQRVLEYRAKRRLQSTRE
jgi:hypothetical protein